LDWKVQRDKRHLPWIERILPQSRIASFQPHITITIAWSLRQPTSSTSRDSQPASQPQYHHYSPPQQATMDSERLFRFPKPQWMNSANTRTAGVYLAGGLVRNKPSPPPDHHLHIQQTANSNTPAQFSIALFILIDAASYSKSSLNGSSFHITFVDWIPGIFSALGMLVINSIDKTRLSGDGFSYSGDGVAWKARVVLFMGFAAMAGGLAGGVCVMVLKYVVNESVWPSLWMGVANVVANALVMLRYVVVESEVGVDVG
jgi:hypothetical protein